MFKVTVPLNEIRCNRVFEIQKVFEYEAISFTVLILVEQDKICFYYKSAQLPKGYKDITMKWKAGVLNQKSTICRHTYCKLMFPIDRFLTSDVGGGIDLRHLDKYKNEIGEITFGIDVESCDYHHQEGKLLQAIYEKLYQQDDHRLIQHQNTIQILTARINELDTVLAQQKVLFKGMKKALATTNNTTTTVPTPEPMQVENEHKNESLVQLIATTSCDDLDIDSLQALLVILPRFQSLILKRLSELNTCVICCVKKKDCIIIPCGHRDSCIECIEKNKVASNQCPVCRTVITNTCRIY